MSNRCHPGCPNENCDSQYDKEKTMTIEEIIEELRTVPTYGLSEDKKLALLKARRILGHLLNFIRTPEWSVSMMEDLASLVSTDLPDFSPGDPRAWSSH